VPLQPVLRPGPERNSIGKTQPTENDIVVVNLPSAHDHDDHGDCIDPMHYPNWQRMQPQPMPSIRLDVSGSHRKWSTCKAMVQAHLKRLREMSVVAHLPFNSR
jgi:hypothetical protein